MGAGGAGGAGGQGWEEGTVGDGTVAQLTGTGYEVGPTVSAAVGVRALGVVALVVGVGAAVLGCWGCAWFLRWCGVVLRWTWHW